MSISNEAKHIRLPFWRKRAFAIFVVVLASSLLHLWSAWQLPLDADEPVYLSAAADYAEYIRAGDFQKIVDYPHNQEHPALVKLVYSLGVLSVGPENDPSRLLFVTRLISAVFGVLSVLVVSLVDPLAGGLLAFHSMTLKYTSEAYLEALPMFASLAAVIAFEKAESGRGRWFWISAVALGAAVAGKYTYAVVILPLLYLIISRRNISFKLLVGYMMIALLTFWILDVSLWRDPIHRLTDSALYHTRYTDGFDVQRAAYPWYQPLLWLTNSVPWHPQVFFFPVSDIFVFWLAVLGLYFESRRRDWVVVWIIGGIALLLLWPTKWPQYTLILTAALSIAAASFLRRLHNWLARENDYWNWLEEMLPRPGGAFWVGSTIFALALLFGKVGYEIEMAQARRGWSQQQADTSPLPANTVNDIAIGNQGEIALATTSGITFWKPEPGSPWGTGSKVYTPQNSGLLDGRILSVIQARNGDWWIGAGAGLSRFAGDSWQNFDRTAWNLPSSQVNTLAEDSLGRIWIGTLAGAAVWDGSQWTAYSAQNSALPDGAVFAIEVQSFPQGDVIWIGTSQGVSRLDTNHGTWETYDFDEQAPGWGGVVDILAGADGTVWAATLGHGLGEWTGSGWKFYRTGNSGIPYNSVDKILEEKPGLIWIGLSFATEPGGVLARFDGKTWETFTPKNSGYCGAEPLALTRDTSGRIWIGMANRGLQIFDPE